MSAENTKKKKILFFVPVYPVLSQTFIEKEISMLYKRSKIDVWVFALCKGKGSITEEDMNDRIIYHRLTLSDSFFAALFGLTVLPGFINAFITILRSKNRDILKKIYIWLKSLGYAYSVKNISPDQIHAHFMSESSTLMLLVSKILNIPLSISGHAKDILVINDAMDEAIPELINEKVKNSRFVSVCNKNAYDACLEQLTDADPKKVLLQYHGMDFKSFEKYFVENKPRNEIPLIFNVGRLEEKKGHGILIEASKILMDRGVRHKIQIAGWGHLYESLKKKIQDLEVNDTVEILGEGEGVSHEKVLEKFGQADIFVLPSIVTKDGDTEGIPNTILEAAYFELPVVTTPTGSIPEIIKDDQTGIFSEPANPNNLSDCIEKAIIDFERSKVLGKNLKSSVLSGFDIEKTIVEIENSLLQN